MITIMSSNDENSSLDYLATECDYSVLLCEIDDTQTEAVCDGDNPGEQCRDVIDREKLLADYTDPFPTINTSIISVIGKIPKLGF